VTREHERSDEGDRVRITIDNLDGWGAVDYTGAVHVEGPITVQRALNEPTRCTAEIVLGVQGLATPVRRGRVVVSDAAGNVMFTGYLATEPVREWVGEASEGPVYRARVTAVSDEWLLDNLGSGAADGGAGAGCGVGWRDGDWELGGDDGRVWSSGRIGVECECGVGSRVGVCGVSCAERAGAD
jgi:hypothetical protein